MATVATTTKADLPAGASSEREPLRFRPAARLQYLLSEQLVSDPNVAVLEFVKNAYDADATDVLIDFDLHDDLSQSSLIIADNGTGMSKDEFRKNWMSPGYSTKLDAPPTSMHRVPVGEKGLGRLAAGRLGGTLDVYTRRSRNRPWFHAFFRWEDFNDQEKLLDEIEVDWDLETRPPVNLESGTVVEIRELSVRWNRKPPGRRGRRAATRIGRLRQDLEVLQLPLTAGRQDFGVRLQHNSPIEEDQQEGGYDGDEGVIRPPKFELLDYEYHFQLRQSSKNRWHIVRTIRRSDEIAARTNTEHKTVTRVDVAELFEKIDVAACGPFEGTFYYAPQSSSDFRRLRVPTGVRIYRDGVRIDPYGDPGDDWLGASERKAVRQGHAAIQPNALYGAVEVERKSNPELNPLANREGFIGNAAFDALVALCREEFAIFGEYVEKEWLEPRWEQRVARRQSDRAIEARQWAVAMTRSTAHAVRQPAISAHTELATLREAIDEADDIGESLRNELKEMAEETRRHLDRVDAAIAKMLNFLRIDPEAREVHIASIAEDVILTLGPDARSARVLLSADLGDEDVTAVAPPGLIENALEELIQNAIQAARPSDRTGRVTIRINRGERVRIEVEDNASGLDDEVKRNLFATSISRTGRVGVGLLINRQLMNIVGGDLELDHTGPDGSQFSLVLPA